MRIDAVFGIKVAAEDTSGWHVERHTGLAEAVVALRGVGKAEPGQLPVRIFGRESFNNGHRSPTVRTQPRRLFSDAGLSRLRRYGRIRGQQLPAQGQQYCPAPVHKESEESDAHE